MFGKKRGGGVHRSFRHLNRFVAPKGGSESVRRTLMVSPAFEFKCNNHMPQANGCFQSESPPLSFYIAQTNETKSR